ncbi:hypothetical protein GW17_00045553 [Ensete ventricosum]|nr:hypothetical protein GW17_00045553 [Ensete ventricosum]
MRALRSRPVETLPLWLLRFKGFFRCFIVLILRWFNHEELALFAAMFTAPRFITMPTQPIGRSFAKLISYQFFWYRGLDVVEGAVGLGMAGRGATLILRTSWFNYSSWICAKEIIAIRVEIVYPCIPDPDGEDEGGQVSSLAVSTRWISIAKLLQSDLATLAQREGEK